MTLLSRKRSGLDLVVAYLQYVSLRHMRTICPGFTATTKICLGLGILLLAGASPRSLEAAGADGPKNATVLLIRHAEKVEDGDGLSPAGEARAQAYVKFFQELTIQSQGAKPTALIATADSKNSRRPRVTLEPLAGALGLPVDARFKNKDYLSMAESLRAGGYDNKTTLVCWHHGDMPDVLRALGVDAGTVLPGRQVARRRIRLAHRAALRRAGPPPVRRTRGGTPDCGCHRKGPGSRGRAVSDQRGSAVGSSSQ